MAHDGNREYFQDLAGKNLGQATAASDALRTMKEAPAGHKRADVDRAERDAKDAIERAADAVRVLVQVEND